MRAHYVDIRDAIQNQNTTISAILDITTVWCDTGIVNMSRINEITRLLNQVENELNDFRKQLQNSSSAKATTTKVGGKQYFERLAENDQEHVLTDIIYKLNNTYAHDDIKAKMRKIIVEELNYAYHIVCDEINTFKLFLAVISPLINGNWKKNMDVLGEKSIEYGYGRAYHIHCATRMHMHTLKIYDVLTTYFVMFTNYFALRRFLDKDYIKNAISYMGAFHSLHCVYNLVKYFGFNVTHVSGSNPTQISDLNARLKNTSKFTHDMHFTRSSYTYTPSCIDMNELPSDLK